MKKIAKKWKDLFNKLPGDWCPIKTAAPGDYFDATAANHVLKFFEECLVFPDGEVAGQPFIPQPHEKAILACLFGWKRKDGSRRFRELFFYVPRKNNKTTFAAGVAIYILATDKGLGLENYSTAKTREQAALIYTKASRMVRLSPNLNKRCKCTDSKKRIDYNPTESFFTSLASDAGSQHGTNVHFAINDELHVHRTPDMVEAMETGTGTQKEPLIVSITTADYNRPNSICNEKLEYAQKVRDGVIESPEFMPVIYETLGDEDWKSPKVWKKANPMLGVSISNEFMKEKCKKAQEQPNYENSFKRFHLNMKTEQDTRWLPVDKWDDCKKEFDIDELEGQPCILSLDLAYRQDVCSAVALFPNNNNRVICIFWLPEHAATRRWERDQIPFVKWVNQGFIRSIEGKDSVDYNVVFDDVMDFAARFDLRELVIDPWNGKGILDRFDEAGLNCIQFGQGFASMSPACKDLETMIVQGDIQHDGNPVLRWMVSNVVVVQDDAGNIKPSKKRSAEKIDGVVALAMCVGRIPFWADSEGKSIYEEREVRFLGN